MDQMNNMEEDEEGYVGEYETDAEDAGAQYDNTEDDVEEFEFVETEE